MSDAALPKKIKLNMKSKASTPVVSRPSSPDGVRGMYSQFVRQIYGSFPLIPVFSGRTHPSTPRGSPPPPSGLGFPTAAEIRAAIPPSGIKSNELIKMFQPRVLGNSKQFIALVKDVAVFTKDNGLIKPKP
jgi:transcription initiation factor TFIIF subunit alpha